MLHGYAAGFRLFQLMSMQAGILRACFAAVLLFATAVAAQAADGVRIHIVSFGLWGSQSVFQSEARGAASIISAKFGKPATLIVRANTKTTTQATGDSLANALTVVGNKMSGTNDVLFLVLTSHGSPDGLGIQGRNLKDTITPGDLRGVLAENGARYKVVIVSACYSGIFTELADANTLVITAARSDRPSFGCQDGNRWTYFGEAFFARAMRGSRVLPDAFAEAKALVTQRELSEGFQPSYPQIAGGRAVLERLSH
jgi:hypothetical protein